jgi:hypothetical protein
MISKWIGFHSMFWRYYGIILGYGIVYNGGVADP